jgi:hypothetical protein
MSSHVRRALTFASERFSFKNNNGNWAKGGEEGGGGRAKEDFAQKPRYALNTTSGIQLEFPFCLF